MGNNYPQSGYACSVCSGSGILLVLGTPRGWMECRYCKGTGKRSLISRNLQRAGWQVKESDVKGINPRG